MTLKEALRLLLAAGADYGDRLEEWASDLSASDEDAKANLEAEVAALDEAITVVRAHREAI